MTISWTGPDGAINLTADDLDFYPLSKRDFGDLSALDIPIAGRHHLLGGGKVRPELEAVHTAPVIALGHFLVNDAAAGGHPLDISRQDYSLVAHAVTMLDFTG